MEVEAPQLVDWTLAYVTERTAFGQPIGSFQNSRFVMAEMGRRLGLLGMDWADATSVQAYTAADIGFLLRDELVRTGAARQGLCWHHCRPPVAVLDYEMDVRGPVRELHLRD